MYIGGTDSKGLHHLVSEVLDNSMDEAVAGFATKIDIGIHLKMRYPYLIMEGEYQ